MPALQAKDISGNASLESPMIYRLLFLRCPWLDLFFLLIRRLVGLLPDVANTRLAAVLSLLSGTNLTS